MIYGNVTGRHIERRPGWHCKRARRVLSPSDSRRRPFLQATRAHPILPSPEVCLEIPNSLCARSIDSRSRTRSYTRSPMYLPPRDASHRFSIGLVNTAEKCRLPAKILPKRRAAFVAWQIYYVRTRAQVRAVRCRVNYRYRRTKIFARSCSGTGQFTRRDLYRPRCTVLRAVVVVIAGGGGEEIGGKRVKIGPVKALSRLRDNCPRTCSRKHVCVHGQSENNKGRYIGLFRSQALVLAKTS